MKITGMDLYEVFEGLRINTKNLFDKLTAEGKEYDFLEDIEGETVQDKLRETIENQMIYAPLVEYTNLSGNVYGAHVIGVSGVSLKIIDLEENEVSTIVFEDISNIEQRLDVVSMMETFI